MKQQFKMKEITQKTGVSKSTIQYYLSLGLLPKPVRTSKNMAYYPALYLEIVPVIKYLKENMHLPLGTIKQLIVDIGFEKVSIENALHYYETFLSPLGYGENAVICNREELQGRLGLEWDEICELENSELLMPVADGLYSPADALAVNAYKKLKERGISFSDVKKLTRIIKKLTHEAHELYHENAKGLTHKEEQEFSNVMKREFKIILNYLINQYLLSIYKEESK